MMLSVLTEGGEDGEGLAATLASLVPGAVEGLVREVVVIDRGLSEGARLVADHAGCRVQSGENLRELVGTLRGDWVLCLETGARLSSGWIERVAQHSANVAIGRASPPAARFRIARGDRPHFLSRAFARRSAMHQGLLLPKTQALSAARPGASSLADLAKGLATRLLDAEISPVPVRR